MNVKARRYLRFHEACVVVIFPSESLHAQLLDLQNKFRAFDFPFHSIRPSRKVQVALNITRLSPRRWYEVDYDSRM